MYWVKRYGVCTMRNGSEYMSTVSRFASSSITSLMVGLWSDHYIPCPFSTCVQRVYRCFGPHLRTTVLCIWKSKRIRTLQGRTENSRGEEHRQKLSAYHYFCVTGLMPLYQYHEVYKAAFRWEHKRKIAMGLVRVQRYRQRNTQPPQQSPRTYSGSQPRQQLTM